MLAQKLLNRIHNPSHVLIKWVANEGFRIKTMIESFYDRWYETWGPAIGEGQCKFAGRC